MMFDAPFCSGYHLVFVSNEEVSCIPCERGRYNPVASSDSSGACRLCDRGDAWPLLQRDAVSIFKQGLFMC